MRSCCLVCWSARVQRELGDAAVVHQLGQRRRRRLDRPGRFVDLDDLGEGPDFEHEVHSRRVVERQRDARARRALESLQPRLDPVLEAVIVCAKVETGRSMQAAAKRARRNRGTMTVPPSVSDDSQSVLRG